MSFDSSGAELTVYVDELSPVLWFARYDSVSGTFPRTLLATFRPDQRVPWVGLKTDTTGVAHLAYLAVDQTGLGELRYLSRSAAGVWSSATVVTSGVKFAALALDSANVPSLAHVVVSGATRTLAVSTLRAGAWARTPVVSRSNDAVAPLVLSIGAAGPLVGLLWQSSPNATLYVPTNATTFAAWDTGVNALVADAELIQEASGRIHLLGTSPQCAPTGAACVLYVTGTASPLVASATFGAAESGGFIRRYANGDLAIYSVTATAGTGPNSLNSYRLTDNVLAAGASTWTTITTPVGARGLLFGPTVTWYPHVWGLAPNGTPVLFGPTDDRALSGLDLMRFTASTSPVQTIRGVVLRESVSQFQMLNAPTGLALWVGVKTRSSDSEVRVAREGATGWVSEVVPGGPNVLNNQLQLLRSTAGDEFLAWLDFTHGIHTLKKAPGGWPTTTTSVATWSTTASAPVAGAFAFGAPVFAYESSVTGRVRFLSSNQEEDVTPGAVSITSDLQLVVDPTMTPSILYRAGTGTTWTFARRSLSVDRSGAVWALSTPLIDGDGNGAQLYIDPAGKTCIVSSPPGVGPRSSCWNGTGFTDTSLGNLGAGITRVRGVQVAGGQTHFLFAKLSATTAPVPHLYLGPAGPVSVGTLPLATLGMAGVTPHVVVMQPTTGQVLSISP